jgi:hypothetical protein
MGVLMLGKMIRPIKKFKIFGFDVETYGNLNKFLMCSIVGNNLKKVFWNKSAVFDFFEKNSELFKDSFIMATNLQFDILALVSDTEYLKRFTPMFRKTNMICANLRLKNNNLLRFSDTMNYSPFSVEKLGSLIKVPKLKKPDFLGKYITDRDKMLELEAYNMNDSAITYLSGEFFQDSFNKMGAELKYTIASASMDLFTRKYISMVYYSPEKRKIKLLLNALRGGRCECVKRGAVKNLKFYDVNSLYPFMMLNEYPEPNKHYFKKRIEKNNIFDFEGVCKADITAPCYYFPYLPFKATDKNMFNKLVFPSGNFSGYYTFFELRKALDLGYGVKNLRNGVIYTKTFTPFKEFVLDLFKKRREYQKVGDNLEYVVKIMLNSLYGKWAQRIENDKTFIHADNISLKMLNDNPDFERIGQFFIFSNKSVKYPYFSNPIFSIYTAAYARDYLFSLVNKGLKDFYYCDTDSLMTKRDYNTGDNLGELKLSKNIKEGVIVRPKLYDDGEHIKAKGFHKLNKIGFNDLLNGRDIKIVKFMKFKEALRRHKGFNEKVLCSKTANLEDNKRYWREKFNPEILQDSSPLMI